MKTIDEREMQETKKKNKLRLKNVVIFIQAISECYLRKHYLLSFIFVSYLSYQTVN